MGLLKYDGIGASQPSPDDLYGYNMKVKQDYQMQIKEVNSDCTDTWMIQKIEKAIQSRRFKGDRDKILRDYKNGELSLKQIRNILMEG